MMQQYRRKYPPNWESLSRACKERANWQCEHCGAKQFEIITSRKGTPYFIYLHAAHKHPYDKSNPNPELIALCITCHARYDYEYKQRAMRSRLEQMKHLKLLIEQGIVTVEAWL